MAQICLPSLSKFFAEKRQTDLERKHFPQTRRPIRCLHDVGMTWISGNKKPGSKRKNLPSKQRQRPTFAVDKFSLMSVSFAKSDH